MELKLISEFGLNDTLLALEPSRRCIGKCGFCYVELNRESRGDSLDRDTPNTFAMHANRAFGPDYDPSDFFQWSLRNRTPITWASGVEPFQDVPKAMATLDVVDRLDLPIFYQTRGINWRKVWPQIAARADQSYLYISFPSPDDAAIARFERGTPKAADRWALIDAAADAGIPIMVGMAPWHRELTPDLPAHVRECIRRGASTILFDPLHLSKRNLDATDDQELIRLEKTARDDAAIGVARQARAACIGEGAAWIGANVWMWGAGLGTHGWKTDASFRLATTMPYHDLLLNQALDELIGAPGTPPILVTWSTALATMERAGGIDQPFQFTVLRNSWQFIARMEDAWKARLTPTARLSEFLRYQWNRPSSSHFPWNHPFARVAIRPDGQPWRSDTGDLVAIYDGDSTSQSSRQRVDDLSAVRRLA